MSIRGVVRMVPKDGMMHAFREELGQLYYFHGGSKNWAMENFHYHESCEILLILCDGVTVERGQYAYKANAGDLIIFSSDEYHRVRPAENSEYRRYVLMFAPTVIEQMSELLGYNFLRYLQKAGEGFIPKIPLSESAMNQIIGYFRRIDKLYGSQKDPKCRAHLYLIIAELLIEVQDMYDFLEQNGGGKQMERSDVQFTLHENEKERVQQIKQYICNNIECRLTLGDIAEQFYLSKYYLGRYFRRETGFSIMQYIKMQKILRAKEMLKEGYSVTQVAMRLGYKSDSHFISTFQKAVGLTPKRYVLEGKHKTKKTPLNDGRVNEGTAPHAD